MSIQDEVSRLNAAKSGLAGAITAKGVTVPAEAKLDDYAALVEQIQAGGGGGMEFKTTYVEVPQHGAPLIVTSIESEDTCIAFVPGFVNTSLNAITITLPSGWTIQNTMYSVYDPQQGMVASTLGSARTIQIPPDGTLVNFSFKYTY